VGNDLLTSLDGLSQVRTVTGDVTIMNNYALPNCEAQAFLDQLTELGGIGCVGDNLDDSCPDTCP